MTWVVRNEAGFDLESHLGVERERVERALDGVRRRFASGALAEAIAYALETRGKRIRPILCVAAYRAAADTDSPPPEVYDVAASAEIVHTYSLVHDDLPCMDDDPLRRGRPTVHVRFGVPTAVATGAALVPIAVATLDGAAADLGLDDGLRARMVRTLCEASGASGMVGGQWMDLESENRPVGPGELEAIHHRKTGALIRASLRLGVQAADGPAGLEDALDRYGEAIGLAFQITDDILDETATSDQLGKTAGKDSSVGKATYPSLYGLEGARSRAEACVERAEAALEDGGLESPLLSGLARLVVRRTA